MSVISLGLPAAFHLQNDSLTLFTSGFNEESHDVFQFCGCLEYILLTLLSAFVVGAFFNFSIIETGRRGRCVKHWSRTPADPGSIPGAGDKNKRLISLPCNIRRCAPRGSHIT